ncbi:MAG: DUF2892 domain-containing protein [Nitrospirota bacterium]
MKKNVGGADKAVRIIIGCFLLVIGFFGGLETGWRIVLLALSGIAFLTSYISL